MNLNETKKEIIALAEADCAIKMVSGSGIGKSELAFQTFQYLRDRDLPQGIKWGMGVVFAATQTPQTIAGLQFKGQRDFGDGKTITISDPSLPVWMVSTEGKPAWMYDRFYLFIDEYGQGEADTKRGFAEVLLNGSSGVWSLPEGSVRIAATNVGARYGVTKDFDFIINRVTELKVTGDNKVLGAYLDKPYYKGGKMWKTMPITKAFIATKPEVVFEPEPKEQGPWCTPRSLCAADRYLQGKAAANNGDIPTDPTTIETLSGIIGMPATQELVNHIAFRLQLPKYEDIVADPKGTPVPQKADLLLLMAYELANNTKPEHLAECITYISRLPKDMSVTYVSSMLRRDYKGIINQPAMQGWINKNAALVSIIASLSQ